MSINRKKTKQINVGGVLIGGGAPIVVQSMTTTETSNIKATIEQIKKLEDVGCEVVRVAVPEEIDAESIPYIKKEVNIPIIADIHFDYRLALKVLEGGIDCLRINPGNIGDLERVKKVVTAAKEREVPIRIGVNAGSLEKPLLEKYGAPTAEAMVESAMGHIKILEDMDFDQIKISLKASDVWKTVDAYRLLSAKVDYPLHLGITEAGTLFSGSIKSAVGLGILLGEGIGDTLRVSLAGDPVEEVRVGWEILKSLEIRKRGVNVISCPTCGRIKIDSITIATEIEKRLAHIKEPLDVAVMGCVVNGPGESLTADVGVAGGDGSAMLYIQGEAIKKINENQIIEEVVAEVERRVKEASSFIKS